MALSEETYTKDEWEALQSGKRVMRPKSMPRPEPAFPKVDNLLKFEDIPFAEIDKILTFNMRRIRNNDGVNFIGYDVTILLRPKRGPGRPKEDETEPPPRILKGWMIEGDYEKLRRQR